MTAENEPARQVLGWRPGFTFLDDNGRTVRTVPVGTAVYGDPNDAYARSEADAPVVSLVAGLHGGRLVVPAAPFAA